MGTITTAAMHTTADGRDRWLTESLGRGAGAFVGRITPAGGRTFYYRYTDARGKRCNLKIGDFDAQGRAGLTVARARQTAIEWAAKYQGDTSRGETPVRDLREHFVRQKQAALAARHAADEAHQREAQERERRLSVRQLFDRWASVDLAPRTSADGTRTGRKDGGEYTRLQFERHVFPSIGDTAAKDVQRADLMAIFDAQKAAGKMRTANVLLSDLKQMLRFAVLRDIVDRNVLDGVASTTLHTPAPALRTDAMPIAKVHDFARPDAATCADLLRRAVVAYMQAGGDTPSAAGSGVRMLKGLGYVVLRDGASDVVAVYRIRPDNLALRRMKRWPAMVTRR